MAYTPIDELPHPPQEWLDAIAEVKEDNEEELVPKSCCGARLWEGDICICKPLAKQTKCGQCGNRGHTKKTCPMLNSKIKNTTEWNRKNLEKSHKLFRKYRCVDCGMCGGSLMNNSNLTRHRNNHGCGKTD
jgi:hypothetical protein